MSRALAWAAATALACWTLVGAAQAGRETYGGLPAGGAVQVLQNPGFLVGYSPERRQPLWVAYRAENLKGRRGPRKRPEFEPDPRLAAPVLATDYRGSGYTRGHLAPNYLIARLYGRTAQHATFLMSNIAPQRRRLNELLWQRLEEAEANIVAPGAVELWVVVGPLFAARPPALRGTRIAVPEAFYRIWLDLRPEGPRALAFVVPQDVCGDEPLSRYLATVDAVERRSGLDFFHELDDAVEASFESRRAVDGWRLERYDRRPARYAGQYAGEECDPG